ncbi:hypothetical protein B0H16DRAFT_1536731, partial [Mycena metata]
RGAAVVGCSSSASAYNDRSWLPPLTTPSLRPTLTTATPLLLRTFAPGPSPHAPHDPPTPAIIIVFIANAHHIPCLVQSVCHHTCMFRRTLIFVCFLFSYFLFSISLPPPSHSHSHFPSISLLWSISLSVSHRMTYIHTKLDCQWTDGLLYTSWMGFIIFFGT